jgi:hypothetical protein
MAKFRTSAHDAPERPSSKPIDPPGTLPPSRIPVLDSKGSRRGHVGFKAGPSVAERFGVRGAKLVEHDGRPAWQGEASATARRRQEIIRAQRVKANKGSVSFKPTRPDKAVRPERGG